MKVLTSPAALQAIPDGGDVPELAGTWRTETDGRTLVVVLARSGATIRGRLDGGSDYCVSLEGTGSEGAAIGTAQGPLGELRFEVVVRGNTLALALTAAKTQTATERRSLYQFTRASRDTDFTPCPPAAEHRDPRALGTWRNASMQTDGASMTTDARTFHFSQDGAFSRNENGQRSSGRWRTVGDVIYTTAKGSTGWQVLATLRPAGSDVRVMLPDGRSFNRLRKTAASR